MIVCSQCRSPDVYEVQHAHCNDGTVESLVQYWCNACEDDTGIVEIDEPDDIDPLREYQPANEVEP